MKITQVLLTAVVLSLGFSAVASETRDFHFTFEHKIEGKRTMRAPLSVSKYEFKTQADTWEDAFKEAAKACYKHFKDGRSLSEDEGLDIIDTCANPRS